ncbi:hypothetical protein ACOTWK_10615 [Aliarcobacter butzleri]|uniref:hypothetical protein n=1 Tax=Aliarcobacter butzleri TaxID=28197 RepID=UPI003AEB3D6C
MNYEEIIKIIKEESYYDDFDFDDFDYDDFDYDDYEIEYKKTLSRGLFLKDNLNTIKLIEEFFYKQLETQDINVDINDVFLFLNIHNQLGEDYSNLKSEINNNINSLTYGGYEFISDDETFEELKKRIESLYNEFEAIETI